MIVARYVTNNISLELVSPYFVDEVFEVVDSNRKYLSEYLTWVEETKDKEKVLENTKKALVSFSEKKSIDYIIKAAEKVIGRISIWLTDEKTRTFEIGYWISEKYSKKGIITSCVKEVMDVGIEYLNVEKFEIICIVENIGSNKIASKLGYRLEGTKRRAIIVNNKAYDMNQYGMLRNEYVECT